MNRNYSGNVRPPALLIYVRPVASNPFMLGWSPVLKILNNRESLNMNKIV